MRGGLLMQVLAVCLLPILGAGCGSDGESSESTGLEFFFFFGDEVVTAETASDVDVTAATFRFGDDDIVRYAWDQQYLEIDEDARSNAAEAFPGPPIFSFVMSYGGAPVVTGFAAEEFVATRVDGPQIRLGAEGLWLSVGDWPDADALEGFGVAHDIIAEIRRHFADTERLE